MIGEREFKILARVRQETGGRIALKDLSLTREEFELLRMMYRAGWVDKYRRGVRITTKGRVAYKCLEKLQSLF